jgi:hypothetical protein
MAKYTARGKTADQVLEDFEAGRMDADYSGNTVEYMQASVAAAAARAQERWAKVSAGAACVSVAIAVVAVAVAIFR